MHWSLTSILQRKYHAVQPLVSSARAPLLARWAGKSHGKSDFDRENGRPPAAPGEQAARCPNRRPRLLRQAPFRTDQSVDPSPTTQVLLSLMLNALLAGALLLTKANPASTLLHGATRQAARPMRSEERPDAAPGCQACERAQLDVAKLEEWGCRVSA